MPIWVEECVEDQVAKGQSEEDARAICEARYKRKKKRRMSRLKKKKRKR